MNARDARMVEALAAKGTDWLIVESERLAAKTTQDAWISIGVTGACNHSQFYAHAESARSGVIGSSASIDYVETRVKAFALLIVALRRRWREEGAVITASWGKR